MSGDTVDFDAWYETTSLPAARPFGSLVRTNPVPMLNTRCIQWSTYRSRIWAMRSLPQKVTGYRYEEETACEQRPRDFKGGYPPRVALSLSPSLLPAPSRFPPPSPRRRFTLVSQLLFFDASSFLIAANRDVKTIRALLLDSEPDAQFFSRYRKPSRSLSFCSPRLCVSGEKRDAFWRVLFRIVKRVNSEWRYGWIKESFSRLENSMFEETV